MADKLFTSVLCEPPVCIKCNQHLTIEHILLVQIFIEMIESQFTAQSLHMLFQDISTEKIFYFLKEINMFGKNLNLRSFLVMFVLFTF